MQTSWKLEPCFMTESIPGSNAVVSLSRNSFQLCLSVFYRPPSSPSSIFGTLSETLLFVPHSYFSNFVILGDFNVNFDVSHHFYTHLSDFMTSFSLSQVVTSPTHFSHCGHPSLIDLVFVSNLSYFSTFYYSSACQL